MNAKKLILQVISVLLVIAIAVIFVIGDGFDIIIAIYKQLYLFIHPRIENLPLVTSIIGTIIALFILFYIIRPHIVIYPYFTREFGADGKKHYQFLITNRGLYSVVNIQLQAKEVIDITANTVNRIPLNCENIPRLSGWIFDPNNSYASFGYAETELMEKGEIKQVELEVIATHPISNVTRVSTCAFKIDTVIEDACFNEGKLTNGCKCHEFVILLSQALTLLSYLLFVLVIVLILSKLSSQTRLYDVLNDIFIGGVVFWTFLSIMYNAIQIVENYMPFVKMKTRDNV